MAKAEFLQQQLFIDPASVAYAVLDGASVSDLLPMLEKHQPEHVCLYRGEMIPELAAAVPYLVRLQHDSPFTEWLLEQGWGQHWGIFATAAANTDLQIMRKHFRGILMVYDPDNEPVYFRYYDPRVLRTYLPTLQSNEIATLFGPVQRYLLEDEDPQKLLKFWPAEGALGHEQLKLVETASAKIETI